MAAVALHSAYVRIRFSAESDLVITDTQGIDCKEELKNITDGEINNICKVVRIPDGINTVNNVADLGI